MRLWGLLACLPLAACLPEARAQPRLPVRDAGAPADRPLPGSGMGLGVLGARDIGSLAPRRALGGTYVARALDAGAPGSLTREQIRDAIREHTREVYRCYEAGLAVDRSLEGRAVVWFDLDAQGAVTNAAVDEDGLPQPTVRACIADAARRWTFPPPGGAFRFRYSFALRAE